jgi:methionyl-tRNA formyltransferase
LKIALLGCKGTTLDLLCQVVHEGAFRVDQVVTLPQSLAEKNGVAFYRAGEIAEFCTRNAIPQHFVRSYHLRDDCDRAFFQTAGIDLLLVIGWERLIPDFVLESLGRFACGMHGSAYGLPKGRGRSPLNWSLICGHTRFVTSLFRYNPLVDAGAILGSKVFEVNSFDTIATLHMKNRIAMGQLLRTYIPLIESDEVTFYPQPPEAASFYPKRKPEDGFIDWRQSTEQIYNLVRALSPTYPPAFCYHAGRQLFVLETAPFDSALFHPSLPPGTVVDVSIALQTIVVQTGDGTLIVKRSEGIPVESFRAGDVLEGGDTSEILRSITARYPDDLPEEQKEIRLGHGI